MAYERLWSKVQQAFAANGSIDGGIQVADSSGFFVTAYVQIFSNTQQPRNLQIKKIVTETKPYTIYVGPLSEKQSDINARTPVNEYLLIDNAQILQPEQKIGEIKEPNVINNVYERDPVKAFRVEPVDPYGNPIGPNNPLAVYIKSLAPSGFGDVQITYDSSSNPIQYNFYLKTVLQGYITVTYDTNDNPINYQGYDAAGNPL